MNDIFSVEIRFPDVSLDLDIVDREASILSAAIARLYVAHVKAAFVSHGAVATRGTLNSTRGISIALGKGFYRRQVIAGKGLKFIISGRRAGAKMPVRFIGTGKRGGKIFEPLPEVLKWLNFLGIPRQNWFAILRAISQRGIRPRDIVGTAMRTASGEFQGLTRATGATIARGIVKVGK